MEKIKVIIADDNKVMNDLMRRNLEIYEDIEVIGSCYSDEEEMLMIDVLKPEIVITDLIRNGKSSGLEIIKKYKNQGNMPKFLVITAGSDELIDTNIMDGFIKKPFQNYNLIVQQIRYIKEQIISEKLPVKRQKEKLSVMNNIYNQLIKKIKNSIKRKNK